MQNKHSVEDQEYKWGDEKHREEPKEEEEVESNEEAEDKEQ